ncbi:universal stress protein [Fructobacillus sp. M1-13]|uniref:Universal stress protein n=1 Tax=Fructobacillus papyriferae TaxID=2713171 RepID=A0ABS5QRR8_9LACO|nr:universal stress protein [Fructobacillus papyriferae]MBS9335617.1 universal stress protein [Fructobacillus papyriferae]MCD2159294.1 universal stress protein [Fructobacillus papyriferae]
MSAFYQKILVPMDGSDESKAALERAISLSQSQGADQKSALVLANVIDTRAIHNISAFDNSMVDTVTEDARKMLEKYQQQAKDASVETVDYRIDYGSPKALLAHDIPQEIGADLIIIGATGLNAVERFVVGSVTSYVTRVSKVDVLVVRDK